MGFLDDAKKRLGEAVGTHREAIDAGLDKAGDLVSQHTGGKYDDRIAGATTRAKDALDGLDGQNDDTK